MTIKLNQNIDYDLDNAAWLSSLKSLFSKISGQLSPDLPFLRQNDKVSSWTTEDTQILEEMDDLPDLEEGWEENRMLSERPELRERGEETVSKEIPLGNQEDVYPDPASKEIYQWIENQLEKANFRIEGNLPYGVKAIGKGIELLLYSSLRDAIYKHLDSLSGSEEESEVISGVSDVMSVWATKNIGPAERAFELLFNRGFQAGMASTGKMGTFDEAALNVIKEGKYRIGERIKLFGDDAVEKFAKVIHDSFTPEGIFSLENLVKEMNEAVPARRSALERIARTETSNVSQLGRIAGWAQDPDKYYWNYMWNSAPDSRRREMKRLRSADNPYTFPEIVFLWTHNEQLLPNGKWQMGTINCRCSISRSR